MSYVVEIWFHAIKEVPRVVEKPDPGVYFWIFVLIALGLAIWFYWNRQQRKEIDMSEKDKNLIWDMEQKSITDKLIKDSPHLKEKITNYMKEVPMTKENLIELIDRIKRKNNGNNSTD